MPQRFSKYCRYSGCKERHRNAGAYCDKHKDTVVVAQWQRQTERRKRDKIWKLYNCVAWPRFKQAFAAAGNVICQRIVDGRQCSQPVEIHHHILPPQTHPGLMYTFSNVVAVCRQHHPNETGEPKENLPRLAEIYVPTKVPRFFGGNQ